MGGCSSDSGRLDYAASVLPDLGIAQLAPDRLQSGERALLIGTPEGFFLYDSGHSARLLDGSSRPAMVIAPGVS
jgi:hypothetical protein